MTRVAAAVIATALFACSPSPGTLIAELTAPKNEIFVVDVPLPVLSEGSTSYRWHMVAAPPTSTAALEDETSRTPYFTPDRGGRYILAPSVDRGVATAELGEVIITVTNRPPVANAGADRLARVAEQIPLDGSGSSDPDGDVISSYEWRIESRPTESTAELLNPTSANPIFVADVPGIYDVSLEVSDGEDVSVERDNVRIDATRDAFMLPEGIYDVVVAYSAPYDRLIVAQQSSFEGTQAVVFDPETFTGTWFQFTGATWDVSVSPDGRYAAFAHDDGVGVLDILANSYRLVPTTYPWRTVAIADGSVAYAARQYVSPPRQVYRIDLSSGAQAESASADEAYTLRHALDHSAVYAVSSGAVIEDGIGKWDTSVTPPVQLYARGASPCGAFWLLDAGRLMTRSGRLVATSSDPGVDLTELGSIPGANCRVQSASASGDVLGTVEGDVDVRAVRFRDAADFALRSELPPLVINVDGEQYQTQPDHVILRGDTSYMVVFELDRPPIVPRFGIEVGVLP